MNLTFLLPYAGMHGGIRVVAIYAQLLRDRGHNVNVISVTKKALGIKDTFRYIRQHKKWPSKRKKQEKTHFDQNDQSWTILNHSGPITDHDLPDADVVIATWWKTAEWLQYLSASKGIKFYFCQGYETHNAMSQKRAEATYRLDMKKICVSDWVRQQIRDLTGIYDQEVVENGVDLHQFYQSSKVIRDSECFGFVFSDDHIKGADIIIGALAIAKAKDPNIRAVAFGSEPPLTELPKWIEFHQNPPQEFIRQIYSQCCAWLFGSRSEGFGLPILEAMACKTPVIATPAGAAPDLISDACGCLVPAENKYYMAQKIIEFSKMSSIEWGDKSESAYQKAIRSDWESSCSIFEKIILKELQKIGP